MWPERQVAPQDERTRHAQVHHADVVEEAHRFTLRAVQDVDAAASSEDEEPDATNDEDGAAGAADAGPGEGKDGGAVVRGRGKAGKKCRHGPDGLTQEERGIGVRRKKAEAGGAGGGGGGGRGRRGSSASDEGRGKKGATKGKGGGGGPAVGERRSARKGGAAGQLVGVAKVSKAVRHGKVGRKGGKSQGRG